MSYELKGKSVPIRLWTNPEQVEQSALDQLSNIAALPWAFHHVAVMPDVHMGKGATIGSVIAMKNAVSPSAVGSDIGCGLGAIKTNLKASDLPDNLYDLRHDIERTIPVGFNKHKQPHTLAVNSSLFGDTYSDLHPYAHKLKENALLQAGTLGGGNHFIELCLDTEQNVWMMLHSGSRNIGKVLAGIHINIAKTLAHNSDLPDPDLAVFLSNTPEMIAYQRDLNWAQQYAFLNRRVMLELYKDVLIRRFPQVKFEEPILCHHNYVSNETHFGEDVIVTRKGAISAKQGELGIIPGSMGDKSYVVRGKGNAESFTSASHGAGRKMSRGAAKRHFTQADLEEQTKNVECRKDLDVLDEIPGAYKNIEEVMKNQEDLVEIVAEIKQVLCVKG